MDEAPQTFGALVFEYLKTLVPDWRLCDEAWLLGNDHLVGIGVERNYGGQLMVIPWADGAEPHPQWPNIEPLLSAHGISTNRIVVVIDDRIDGSGDHRLAVFTEVLWSEREHLKDYAVKDQP